jgi:ADP-heptose:LPS heptosyltransferase
LSIIVVGDKSDAEVAEKLAEKFTHVGDACGKFSINQSASIIQQSKAVITSDTGLMHIASAFKKKIFSLWGNTIPEFGMGPYLPGEGSRILETKISCRPCSKLGYHKCPKGHFRCMMEINISEIDL